MTALEMLNNLDSLSLTKEAKTYLATQLKEKLANGEELEETKATTSSGYMSYACNLKLQPLKSGAAEMQTGDY